MKVAFPFYVALICVHKAQCFFPFIKNGEKDPDLGIKTIRGVPQNKMTLYESDNHQCDGGTKNYFTNEINDGFCDCVDGTDEPGTSACPGNIFHCVNKGHRVTQIPSSRVDDGKHTSQLACYSVFL